MKRTLIILLASASIAGADWNNSYTDTDFTLDGTTTKNDRLIFAGGSTYGTAITVTSDVDVVVGEINANSSGNINSVTFNLGGTFTIDGGQSLFGKPKINNVQQTLYTTLNLGETGKFVVINNNFCTGQKTQLTLNALLSSNITERVLVDASSEGKFINAESITLNIASEDGHNYGGLVYEYNGKYYSSTDVTNLNGRLNITDSTQSINLTYGTLYTIVSACKVDDLNPVFNKITLKVIPEPTTATLSLLALAGLAARRRRK